MLQHVLGVTIRIHYQYTELPRIARGTQKFYQPTSTRNDRLLAHLTPTFVVADCGKYMYRRVEA